MQVKYTVSCSNKDCHHKRAYEAETLGEAMEQAREDGWQATGVMLHMVCKKCTKSSDNQI